jgi:hypothetical protein
VREAQPAAGPGHADLARVQVAGENEVEGSFGQPIDDIREVAEEDAQVGVVVR